MTSKVFAEKGRVKLVGDNRDVAVSYKLRADVWAWCQVNEINLEYQGSLAGIDLWRAVDEKHRMWFTLRWS